MVINHQHEKLPSFALAKVILSPQKIYYDDSPFHSTLAELIIPNYRCREHHQLVTELRFLSFQPNLSTYLDVPPPPHHILIVIYNGEITRLHYLIEVTSELRTT